MKDQGHRAARPLEVIRDKKGNEWLCDQGVSVDRGIITGQCVPDEKLAFTRND